MDSPTTQVPGANASATPYSPRRVAYVIDTLYANTGGTEGQLLRLLESLDRTRFLPSVYCLRPSEWLLREFRTAPYEVLDLHLAARPSLLPQLWAFSRTLKRQRIDLVQTHFRDANVAGVLAASMAGVPVIVSTRRGVPYWQTAAGLRFLRWLNRRVTWFVANSQATRDRYAREEGIDPAQFDVIYNGLEFDRFRPIDAAARGAGRAALGLPPDAPVVGIVANLRKVKGIDDFLHAAARVRERHPEVRFLVLGDGPEEGALRALTTELGLDDRVTFLGSREDIPDLLQLMDVGVLASHFESFSNAILEYVAAGLPAVVTDVGGAREVVRHERNGFLIPPRAAGEMAERIRFLLEHSGGSRAWLSGPALDPVFQVDAMVRAHETLYTRLLSGVPR